jgi:hypothetical protein
LPSGDDVELLPLSNYDKSQNLTSSNFTLTIDSYQKTSSGYTCLQQSSTLAFSFINQTSTDVIYKLNVDYDSSKSDSKMFTELPPRTRFKVSPESEDLAKVKKDTNFYIIYTLPDRVEDYVSNNQSLTDVTLPTTTTP